MRHCRQDFFPASKLQTEDDITASVVVPADKLKGKYFREGRKSLKFSQNCEFRLFQVCWLGLFCESLQRAYKPGCWGQRRAGAAADKLG